MKKRYDIIWIALLILFLGCQKNNRSIPINKSDVAPPQVSDVKATSIPGGALISYSLPQSKSLLYVQAQYERNDKVVEGKASHYNNSIRVEGLANTNTHIVKLYSVSFGGKKSDAVEVKIKPLTPPVVEVFKSLVVKPTFGGVNVNFINKFRAKVKINVLTPNSSNELSIADSHSTDLDSGAFSVRGFDSTRREFGFFISDQWNNHSDTMFTEVKPFYEEELNKSNFKEVQLSNDSYKQFCCGTGMVNLWDGIENVGSPVFHTMTDGVLPQWFTFDLGKKVLLDRFKIFSRNTGGTDGAYYAGDPKEWEIWGSNDPDPDGSWDSWTLLGHFSAVKPSGQDKPTSEDLDYACVEGQSFNFSVDSIPAVRYLRFKTLKTWGNVGYIYIAELSFWKTVK